ncbi:Alpha-tubulin N-acetyltransferase 1 [Nymphon striatum]|nr:Alpha-tubulin N-acetyltransferase 1 [Nymphon striatum]
MDFTFDINSVLKGVITKVDAAYITSRNRSHQELLCTITDALGDASAKAQKLLSPITTGRKLLSSDHILYILSNPVLHNNLGAVIGMLKIGRKHLFLINEAGEQVEMFPLCILDFYIHESQQRQGYGKKMFEFMLKEENILPEHLAIDRPSEKFISFLRKHYSLWKIIPQVNNFVIFSGYFNQNQNRNNNNNLETRTAHQRNLKGNHRAHSITVQKPPPNEDCLSPLNNSVANVVFGKDISQFSRNLSQPRLSSSSMSPESLNTSMCSRSSKDRENSLSPSTSFEDNSCTSPIKWHQHHTLKSSWSVLGVPPPEIPPNSR